MQATTLFAIASAAQNMKGLFGNCTYTNRTSFDADVDLGIALVARQLWVNSGMFSINAVGSQVDVLPFAQR